jgi:exodeoxyribonuclease VIII
LKGGPHNIPEDVYRADNGVNISTLKHFKDTPSKAKRRMDFPRAPSPAMELGTAIHMAILERDRFLDTYTVRPQVDARTKAGKEALAKARDGGKIPLEQADYEAALMTGEKLRSSPFYSQFLDGGLYETSWFAEHDYGVRMKGRLDVWLPEKNVIVDIKTCESADERSFAKDAYKYHYHAQAAWYSDLVRLTTGRPVDGYVILAVEKAEDRDVRAFWLSSELIQAGRSAYSEWLGKWLVCEKTGSWPGYEPSLVTLDLPNWMRDETF